jgi:hypothetical protein
MNGIVFLTSFLNDSSVLYRNATDFHVLILYPVILLNSVTHNLLILQNLAIGKKHITPG